MLTNSLHISKVDGESTLQFKDYDKVLAYMEKATTDDEALKSLGVSVAEKILQLGRQATELRLDPLRDYDSLKTQIVWQSVVARFKKSNQSENCKTAKSITCEVYREWYPTVLFELMIAQSKQVYYNPNRDKKALAHQEAVKTFSLIRSIIEEEQSSFSVSDHFAAKTYVLAHELTNQPYYKFLFSYYSSKYLALHFYGEVQFKNAKQKILRDLKNKVITRTEEIQEIIGKEYNKRHTLNFFLDMALTENFANKHAYLIEDEKGRLLGDEWKLYNNSVPYFDSGLKTAMSLLEGGRTLESIGWTKIRLVDRTIKAQSYLAQKSFSLPWGEIRFNDEKTHDRVSKRDSWKSLGPYIAAHSVDIYFKLKDSSEHLLISTDEAERIYSLHHIHKYL